MPGPRLFRLQLRHGGFDPGQARVGAHHVKVVAHAGIAQGFSDGPRFLLGLEVGQGDLLA